MVLISCDGCVMILKIRVRCSCLEALICHWPANWLCQWAGTVGFIGLSLLCRCFSLHCPMSLWDNLIYGLISKSHMDGHILSFVLSVNCGSFLPTSRQIIRTLGVVTLLAGVMDQIQLQVFSSVEACVLLLLSWVCNQFRCYNAGLSLYLPHWSPRVCRKTSF